LNLFKKHQFDSFGLDVAKMSGLDLCKLFEKKRLTHQYFFTARDTVQKTIEGIGANDYIKNHLVLKN
jgi:DNA-binding response OmpR family regulator